MVLFNIAPNADLANGSRGIITDIILDLRESIDTISSTTIKLTFPPAAVLFKPLSGGKTTLQNLPPGIIPIFPTQMKFTLAGNSKCTVSR